MNIQTQYTDSIQFEWKSDDGLISNALVNSTGDNSWTTIIPAALQPTTVQWRVLLEGEGPEQTTPWFTLAAEESSWEVSENAVYLQAFALLFMTAGIVIALQTRFTSKSTPSKYDEAPSVLKELALIDTLPPSTELTPPPLPATGLPIGWTEEQWNAYGHDYLTGKHGGELA